MVLIIPSSGILLESNMSTIFYRRKIMEYNHQERTEKKQRYSRHFDSLTPKDKGIVYLLWQIHHKKLSIGSIIYYDVLEEKFKVTKANRALIKEFLSGANVAVNDVVIADKVPKELAERFQLLDE